MHPRNPNNEVITPQISQSTEGNTSASPPAGAPWISPLSIQNMISSLRNLSLSPIPREQGPTPTTAPATRTPPKAPPPPTLLPRLRALTLPLPVPPRRRTYTSPQHSSPFITTLPLDVRYLIYDYVFHGRNCYDGDHGAKAIHIFETWMRQGERGRPRGGLAHSCASDDVLRLPVVFIPGRCAHHGKEGFLGVVLTCRIVYSEAILHLYSTATFLFFNPRLLSRFATMILPQRLNLVCSLRVEWERTFAGGTKADQEWIEAWGTIASMKALRQLRVSLRRRMFESTSEREKVVEPMMTMKGLTVFELLVPVEEEGYEWDSLISAPFTIVDKFSKTGQRDFN